ncbi:hypothetical protein Q4O60_01330 [Aeribacillus pallidus]|nr:hypothetical protein [Aeribacillus pallidus]
MKQFFQLQFFYVKRLLSLKLYWISYVLLLGFTLFTNINYDNRFLSTSISDLAVPMQIHSILMMLSGFLLFRDEMKYGILTIYHTNWKDHLSVIAAVFFNHFLISFLFFCCYYAVYFIRFINMGILNSTFYGEFLVYLLIFWFLEFLLFFLIGSLTALFFNQKKFSFLLIILLWLVFAPFNSFIFSSIIPETFYIYPEISKVHFDFLHRFYFDRWIEWQSFFWFLFFIGLLIVYFLVVIKDRLPRLLVLAMMFAVILADIFIFTNYMDFQAAEGNESEVDDLVDLAELKRNYDIKSVDIQIDHDHSLAFHATVQLGLHQKTNLAHFYLDDSFTLLDVVDKQTGPLPFKQEGSLVTVQWKENVKGERTIQFTYQISKLLEREVKNGFVFTNQEAWMPVKPSVPLILREHRYSFIQNPLANHESVRYTVAYKGRYQLYTSLNETLTEKQAGVSNQGVFLMAGDLTEKKVQSYHLIQPSILKKMPEDFDERIEDALVLQQLLAKKLKLLQNSRPLKKIVVCPIVIRHYVFQNSLYMNLDTDHYDQQEHFSFEFEEPIYAMLFPEGADSVFTYHLHRLVTMLVNQAFHQSASGYTNQTESDLHQYIEDLIEQHWDDGTIVLVEDEKDREVVRSILPIYKRLTEEQKEQFLYDLYHHIDLYAIDWQTFYEKFLKTYGGLADASN